MKNHEHDHPGESFGSRVQKRGNLYFLVVGLAAMIWVTIRVLPKPARAGYPCMKVAISLATGLLLQVSAVALSVFTFQKARVALDASKYRLTALLVIVALALPNFLPDDVYTGQTVFEPKFQPANQPMGEARGVFPGRVVWVHDPGATNENCAPARYDHGWFLSENSNQPVIDRMLSDGLQALTARSSDSGAWHSIFRFYNKNAGKGEIDYRPGERIFVKTNATSSWTGNINTADLTKIKNQYYGISETSPQLVLSVLRQLVNVVGVAQTDIWVGDPLKHIYKHCYDLWHSEFPSVHYLDHDGWNQREKVVASSTGLVRYSDRGAVLHAGTSSDAGAGDPVLEDRLYTVFEDAEYMINIPMLKGHKHAGITAFAKNHFGSQTRDDASHLHNGLVAPEVGNPRRQGYGLYRVQVDLMGHRLLGAKNLLYLMDALWATDFELGSPVKWMTFPFNNDWMSSLFVSFDPVAIESVGFDFLRAEFTPARGLSTYAQMEGVDDYLHQAADSSTWPTGLIYDPENDGTPIPSLGVHEHWNNATDKQYSRNLKTGNGIELLQVERLTQVSTGGAPRAELFQLYPGYPNPFNPATIIRYEIPEAVHVSLTVHDIRGEEVAMLADGRQSPGQYTVEFDGSGLPSGTYFCLLKAGSFVAVRKVLLVK